MTCASRTPGILRACCSGFRRIPASPFPATIDAACNCATRREEKNNERSHTPRLPWSCAGRRRCRSCRHDRRSLHCVRGGHAGRPGSGTGRDKLGSRDAGAVGSSTRTRLGAAATAQAPLGLLVAPRSPPLRVAMVSDVREELLRSATDRSSRSLLNQSGSDRVADQSSDRIYAQFPHG
jgi:hypothetical protein